MKNLLPGSISVFAVFLMLSVDAISASKESLSVKQIMQKSSPARAMSIHKKYLKKKPGAAKLKQLKQRNISLQARLRRPAIGVIPTEDQEYSNLIAPLNWCTTLVRKTCGSEKQCPDSTGCPLALQFLELYNNENDPQEKMDLEGNCIISLQDNYVFPNCE